MTNKLIQSEKEQIEIWGKAIVKACYEARKSIPGFKESIMADLTGACAIAAFHLKEKMKKHNMNANFVVGEYITADGEHCWVEYKKKIIDPTACQFNLKNKKIFQPRHHWNKYYVGSINPPLKDFKEWQAQNPNLYYCYWVDDFCWLEEKKVSHE